MDGEVSKEFEKILKKQGMAFKLGTKVTGVDSSGESIKVTVEPAKGGAARRSSATPSWSRSAGAYTEGLGLEKVGVRLDNRGRVETDGHFGTSVTGVWAIGDVIVGPMLAHKAEEEGSCVAEQLAGEKPHIDYDIIPGVVYTTRKWPLWARPKSSSRTPASPTRSASFRSWRTAARGRSDYRRFVKLLADAATDRVLGAHIIGPEAGILIAEVGSPWSSAPPRRTSPAPAIPIPPSRKRSRRRRYATFAKPIHM